ncbi:MAG: hypothetical protein KGL39_04510 [Patescibacteria group bacterium]|nr:hypothetical protein [Patescibacteria group bacterium]
MPRGHYDRDAARARRESMNASPNIAAKPQGRRIVRDENWGKRTRKIKGEVNYRDLIPENEFPDDAIYQWKTVYALGKMDENKIRLFHENGWSPVPHSRHPYMPKDGDYIRDEDAMLMEQPFALYEEAREAEERAHQSQLRMGQETIKQTQQGQMDRRDLGTNVKTAPMVIEADDTKYQRE